MSEDRREQSAQRHGVDAWAVDSQIHISHIHVIESLDDGFAGRTGTRLFQDLEPLCHPKDVRPLLHTPRDRAALFTLLDQIARDAEHGQYPLLHFETHGIAVQDRRRTSPGIVLASREGVTWQELSPRFTVINEHTRLRLLVFMAACYGADLATLIQPLAPAPVRFIIGPTEEVPARAIETATGAFYRALLQNGDGNAAFRAIDAARGPDDPVFWKLPAETLFLEIVKGYYNEMTTDEQITARVEGLVAPLALRGVPANETVRQRAILKAHLEDRRWLFEKCYRRFFLVDKYPEIAERFILSFERCFLDTAANG
jgi:hypothetical protein